MATWEVGRSRWKKAATTQVLVIVLVLEVIGRSRWLLLIEALNLGLCHISPSLLPQLCSAILALCLTCNTCHSAILAILAILPYCLLPYLHSAKLCHAGQSYSGNQAPTNTQPLHLVSDHPMTLNLRIFIHSCHWINILYFVSSGKNMHHTDYVHLIKNKNFVAASKCQKKCC